MGYTHYWSFNKAPKGKAKELEAKYQKAIIECQKVIRKLADENRALFGSSGMSGYSAHCKPGEYGGIKLNGSKGRDAEDFIMREHFSQNVDSPGFCKTNWELYDEAVVCCLLILKYRLGDAFEVRSDGDWEGWHPWAEYVSEALKRKVKVPDSIRQPKTMRLLRA